MDLLSRTRVLTTGIIVLTLLNVAALGTLWWQNLRPPLPLPGVPPLRESPGEFIERRLGLNIEQKRRFGELRAAYRAEADGIERRMRDARRELYDALRGGAAPDSFVAAKTEELGTLEAQLQRATFMHFRDLRGLCDSLQRPALDALVRDVFERGSPVPPGGEPPGARPGEGSDIPLPPPGGDHPPGAPPPGPPR
ncbi:MAG TPA: periplasmic heavy metal sensor [Bacteroidota bacterium]|nr:periplasmic heavy metal sensor [Bacteroidota bacterium]